MLLSAYRAHPKYITCHSQKLGDTSKNALTRGRNHLAPRISVPPGRGLLHGWYNYLDGGLPVLGVRFGGPKPGQLRLPKTQEAGNVACC
jgi:hypothetical protein